MAAAGITRLPQRSLPIRLQQVRLERWMSKLAGLNKERNGSETTMKEEKGMMKTSCWIPHKRTGIYFPQGHESVIDDIPNGAASLTQTYWLRSDDGVDKPDPGY